ncbi:ABC transporter permease [Cryobacterium melibiosiphilum]|uniref:ABC transporter permease n=1 Tax=Cryobacterium melibiosiphilum TaxID=995039 RepID=A0A3A5MRF1_9MICO|nr:ABC transporter permease [Cryobacterium melibiosiphilum]RJT89603.1 ABC transporter permease [Cryobacterium melibiosiphilum]
MALTTTDARVPGGAPAAETGAPRPPRRQHPLLRYISLRFGISILLVWGVTVVTFVVTNLVPTDPVNAVLGEQAANNPEIVAALRTEMGLDEPLIVQYWLYLTRLLAFDMGVSAQTRSPVADDLARAFPATLELALFVLLFSTVIGVGLGMLAALRHQTAVDKTIRVLSLFGISLPVFWIAMLIYYVFFYQLHWAPGSGRLDSALVPPPLVTGMYTIDSLVAGQPDLFWNALSHLVLPAVVLTLFTIGTLVRFSRSAILDVVRHDYVQAARAKGLPHRIVVVRYILRGASLPILTMSGLTFGSLLSGAVLTESVFSWHGLGQYAYMAAISLDLQAIMGVGLLIGVVYIFTNFAVDLLCGLIDPRVRVQ